MEGERARGGTGNGSEMGTGAAPTIVAFFCNWCTYTAADLAGTSRIQYPPNVRIIRVMCSGRIDPQFVMEAFARGADGVLIGGCHPGDCHYIEGNYKALRRVTLLRRMLRQMGIEDERLRLEWISASEGEKVARVVREMVQALRGLGRLDLPGRRARWDAELLPADVAASEELPPEVAASAHAAVTAGGR